MQGMWSCTQYGRLNLRDSSLRRNQACRPTAPAADSFAHNVWDVQNIVQLGSAQQSLVRLGSGAGRISTKSSRRPSFIHRSSSEKTLCRSGIQLSKHAGSQIGGHQTGVGSSAIQSNDLSTLA